MYLSPQSHACYLYDPATSHRFAFQFLQAGLARGECCLYVADHVSAFQAQTALRELGVRVQSAQASGALHLVTKHETYLRMGTFDPGGMIDFLTQTVAGAVRKGFPGIRVVGEMNCLLDCPGLMEYEAEVNVFLRPPR